MLDFRPKGRGAPNYLGRREQWRLLLLVACAAAVMLVLSHVRQPQAWRWMWQMGGRRPQAAAGGKAGQRPDDQRRLARREVRPGEFIAEGPQAGEVPAGKEFFPGVEPEFLATVRDDTHHRAVEADAFYHLLRILAEQDEATLERSSIGPVTFTQLDAQPKEYRGELVTLRGTLRRAQLQQAGTNDYDVTRYYYTVVEPADRAEPVVVDSLELPEGISADPNAKLDVPVQVTGFFYKRWAHMSRDGIRTYPLILARTLRVQRPAGIAAAPPAAPAAENDWLVPALVATTAVSLILVVILWRNTKRGRARFALPQRNAEGDLEYLKSEPVAEDVRGELRRLAKEHRQ